MSKNKKNGTLEDSKRIANGMVEAGRYIPMSSQITPGIIKFRANGDLCATWKLHGVPFESTPESEIAAAKEALVSFLHAIRGTEQAEPTALWVHRIRREFTDELPGEFSSEFASNLNSKYWAMMGTKPMMLNEIYLSVVLRPSKGATNQFKFLTAFTDDARKELQQGVIDRFETLCAQVSASLKKYGGERLVCVDKVNGAGQTVTKSPALSLFKFLLTGVWEDVTLAKSAIYNYLCDARIHAGDTNGIVQAIHPKKTTYVGYMDFADYPEFSDTGMLNALFYGDYPFVETQSFSYLNKRDGIASLELQRNRLKTSGEASEQQIDSMNDAIEDVRNGRVFMGDYHYTLAIHGGSVKGVKDSMSKARAILQEDLDFKVAAIDVIPECAHFAQLPGNWRWVPRKAQLHTRNFASLSPMHNFDLGKRSQNPWGDALTILRTPGGQPYYLNLHQVVHGQNRTGKKDAGNTFICGMTGTGKSVTMGFILSQMQKVKGLRTLFFDKDQGAEIMIRALGGSYRTLKRGQYTGFNPFQWPATPANVSFLQELVKQCCLRGEGDTLSARAENELNDAIGRVLALPDKQHRRISTLLQFIDRGNDLAERLSKWCHTETVQGSNAWVLDNEWDTTDFSNQSIFGFDYTDFLNDPECGPIILSYILYSAETLLNGDPYVYVMEEFAKMVASKAQTLVEFARDKQTTIRKLNGLGIFVTQSPSQVIQYPIGDTLREQCVTQIYLPNPAANRKDYVEGFQLTEDEFDLIKGFAADSRMFLVKQGQVSVICQLNLAGFDDELAVISGDKEMVEILHSLIEKHGEHPDKWMAPFLAATRKPKHSQALALNLETES